MATDQKNNAQEKIMKHQVLKSMVAAMVIILFFAGGATAQNLLRSGVYKKETVTHRQTDFRQVWVENEARGLKVTGRLHLKSLRAFNIPDYVEVSLVDKDGSVIETQKVEYFPRSLTGKGLRHDSRFSAIFSQTPPPGTIIRLNNIN